MKAGALATLIILVSLLAYVPFAPLRMYDFRAFYCAGRAVAAHADPYREHPLHECERSMTAPGIPADANDVTVPAPLPGFVLAGFAGLARLPFPLCAAVWLVISILAVAGSAELLARSIGIPRVAALIAAGLPAAIVVLPLGQVTPFVGLGIAICAFGLRRDQPRLAALGALLTAIDPPVALAICSALFVDVARTRLWLVVGTALLAGASLTSLGLDRNVEYLTRVLHAHALANVADRTQFSVTHFAWAAGLDRPLALGLGSYWYALALTLGVWFARRLRREFGSIALALVPPAFAVFGGIYVHFAQLALAIPAFLLLAARQPRGRRRLCAGIFILTVPWMAVTAFPVLVVAIAVAATAFCRAMAVASLSRRLSLWSAGILVVLFGLAFGTLSGASGPIAVAVAGNPLADVSWQRYEAIRDAHPVGTILFLQIPTVVAFTSCLLALVRAAVTPDAYGVATHPLRASGR